MADGPVHRFENNGPSLRRLLQHLARAGATQAVCEATGGYDPSTWDVDPSNAVIPDRQLRHVFNGLGVGDKVTDDLSFHWLQFPGQHSTGQFFVPTPNQILDLPPNVLNPEDSYTLYDLGRKRGQ